MIAALKEIDSFDALFFTPHPEEDDWVHIHAANYKKVGEKIGGTALGDFYDIILFRLDDKDEIVDLDKFEAILVDPKVYVSRMVKEDWYGMVAKKTTTSNTFVEDIFAKWNDF
jgi:hypothetical protein